MPYTIQERNGQWCVINENTNEPVDGGCHNTRDPALEHLQALEANVSDTHKAAELHDYTYNGVSCRASRRRPSSRDDKKYERDVVYQGKERLVHYGQPNEQMERDVPESRENFLSRHSCDEKKDPFAAGFWACYDWKNTDEKAMNDKAFYFGTTVKAVNNHGLVEGLLIPFTSPEQLDLDGQYFDETTEFYIDPEDVLSLPPLYHHGLDETMSVKSLGKFVKAWKDDKGWWVQAQIDLNDDYNAMVFELVKQGKLGWSSGALPTSVKVVGQHITNWRPVEGSLTPTPAMPQLTKVHSLKSLVKAFKEHNEDAKETITPPTQMNDTLPTPTGKATTIDNETSTKDVKAMKEQLQQLQMMIAEMLSEMGEPEAEDMAKEAMSQASEELPDDAKMEETPEEYKMNDEELKSFAMSVTDAALKLHEARQTQRADIQKTIKAKADAHRAAQLPKEEQPVKSFNSEKTPEQPSKGANITVGELRAYAGLDASEMLLGAKLAYSRVPEMDKKSWKLGDFVDRGILSEEYIKTMTHKAGNQLNNWTPRNDRLEQNDYATVKAATNWLKADELHATDITNQGAEWVELAYSADLWRRVRDETELFNLMQQKGMRVEDVPEGRKGVNIKLETGSGTVYTLNEANSTDATGRPETVAQLSNLTTDEVEANLATHILAKGFTFQLQERSIIDVVSYLNEDMLVTLSEAIEDAMINGDTTTTSSNINSSTAPATGMQTPLYIAWDGIRHNFLVENTSVGTDRANAVLSAEDYERARALFPLRFRRRKQNMLFVIDEGIETQTRRLSEWYTTADPISQAPFFSGDLSRLVGVDVYASGFLAKSDGSGFIDTSTPANNTQGQIVGVYAPYWHYARQLNINIEEARYPLSQSTVFVATVNHLFKARSLYASVGLYDIQV